MGKGTSQKTGNGISKLRLKNLISLPPQISQWIHGFVSAGVPTAALGATEVPRKLAGCVVAAG